MVRGREEGYLWGYLATLVSSDSALLLASKEGFDSLHPLQDIVRGHPVRSEKNHLTPGVDHFLGRLGMLLFILVR